MSPEEMLRFMALGRELDAWLFDTTPEEARAFIVAMYGHPPEYYESLHSN